MIISCSSCQTKFRIDESLLAPDGKKVRCSKCGHVWRAMPEGQPAPSGEQPAPVAPPAEEPVPDASPEETTQAEQPAERVEPVLSARDETNREDGGGESDEPDEAETPGEEAGPDGLTGEQRAKLTAARQQKPRSWFWIKVLSIFIIVAGVLLIAQRMLPPDALKKIIPASEQPADVGEVEAKPVPAEPEKGGYIIGDEPPALPEQPAQ